MSEVLSWPEMEWTALEQQISNMSHVHPGETPDEFPITPPEANQETTSDDPPHMNSEPDGGPDRTISHESTSQPESEVDHGSNDHQCQNPDELMYLISEDTEEVLLTSTDQHVAWHCEVDVKLPEPLDQRSPTSEEAWMLLATGAKKQRSEVRFSELSLAERQEFDQAKDKEIPNWLQTGTLTKAFRNETPQEQILKMPMDFDMEASWQCGKIWKLYLPNSPKPNPQGPTSSAGIPGPQNRRNPTW